MTASGLSVTAAGDRVTVDTGPMTVGIDAGRTGFVTDLSVGGKVLVRGNREPPLFASVLAGGDCDGWSDFAGGAEVIAAGYEMDECTHRGDDGAFEMTTLGRLVWAGGDEIAFELRLRAAAGGNHLAVEIGLEARGEFEGRFIREIGLQLPLALGGRKRVVQAGDRGIRFDTRSCYQYHAHVGFLENADFNFWQHFHVDQGSAHDYHLWRAESLSTSALSMFRGRRAPGWTTAYDQGGGVLMAYRDMAGRAPKCLYVGAAGGGVAKVCVRAPTHPAVDPHCPAAAASIFARHRTDWIFFAGPEAAAEPEKQLASIRGEQPPARGGPVRPDEQLERIDLLASPITQGDGALLATGGIPLPPGAIRSAEQVRLLAGSDGAADVPLQTRSLAYWPDGSIKWLLLTFPTGADGSIQTSPSHGEEQQAAFDVTRRDGGKLPFRLHFGPEVQGGRPATPLTAEADGDTVRIATGPLELTLAKGRRWLRDVRLNGRAATRDDDRPLAFVDFLKLADGYPPMTTHPAGETVDGELVVDDLRLEEFGPLRAVVRLEGLTAGEQPTRIILRVEAYAGRSYVRLLHSAEFLQDDPRAMFVRRMGLRLPLALGEAARVTGGGQDGPVELLAGPAALTGLRQANPMHYDLWQQDAGRRSIRVQQAGNRSRGWLTAADEAAGVTVVLRNMWQEAPNELVFDAGEGSLTVFLWPQSSPLMDVRRYSNYMHSSQGESDAGVDSPFWIDEFYYRRDPFRGTSKTHEMLLVFHDADLAAGAVDSLAADFQSGPLVYAGAEWYWDTKVLLPTIRPGDPTCPLADANLARAARFILFHQKHWNWYGKWDHGDIGHMFKSGYGKVVPPERLAEVLALPPQQRRELSLDDLQIRQDYWPQHDWAFDNGRWGWGNTEGLPNLFLQAEYLRSGDRELYFFIEAMARHVRDVDMRHAGVFLGRGTRHGVQHWSDGDHEERQSIHSEFRYHHYLSGDMRSADFAGQLSEQVYLKGECSSSAAHSGRLYGLLTRWEMTGDERIGRILRDYVHVLVSPEGIRTGATVAFPQAVAAGDGGSPNQTTMFFEYFGALHALLEYYELTRDPTVRAAVIKYADEGRGDIVDRGTDWPHGPIMAMAFAARYADDPQPYRDALAERIRRLADKAFHCVDDDPRHWTGPTAPVIHFPILLFWLNEAGYALTSLDREPTCSPEELAAARAAAQYTGPTQVPAERETWQTEYDRPAFRQYITPKRPVEP